jgi:phage terminase large subunit
MSLWTKPQGSRVHLPDVVGRGYGEFWRCKKNYRVCKGSRASKKSKTTALNFISRIIEYPESNLLVVRKTYRSLKDSCYTELKWAIHRLGLDAWFDAKESPLEITYTPTGQKILFRGLDDPLKVASVTVSVGVLCWLWIEEAYEITDKSDFDTLNESIRGEMPEGLFRQVTLTFNPWNEHHWLKKRFFDDPPDPEDVFAITTDYRCNEWLSPDDLKLFETMKRDNPRRYAVAGLGNWGIVEGVIYERYEELAFDLDELRRQPGIRSAFGLDFGYTNDPSALFCGLVDTANKILYVFDELYERGLTNDALYSKIQAKGYAKEQITADSAEPKSIDELQALGLARIRGAHKGKDSIAHGIQYLQNYKIIIHPQCVNFLREIANYAWKVDRSGARLNVPIDDENHLMDAMRYAVEDMATPEFDLRYLL